ncbi:SERINE/THREONINE-PROTEIN PHOSPHATASE 2A 55 KDA REGULATORY SUBUNIT B [Salix viminalis]|uniref:Serine/threonine-protein phosphatase 2A 55 kDa regulatory subunit B n=1 Tax=Salix viminalis TaxID=40686 RepID=A0A9Q0T874_SALVM|nr:SERINE/THREONINE-PROTEIN PHOSPHATASE 2A 55 KDA REGULATORY SUBUNIT B [Salix viminalis]
MKSLKLRLVHHNLWSGNSLRSSVNEPTVKKCKKLYNIKSYCNWIQNEDADVGGNPEKEGLVSRMAACLVGKYIFDIISAIEFDRSGDHLATGDRGGRVVLFERTDTKDHGGSRRDLERMGYPISRHPEFRYKTEFQSHEPEFDYLKSLEIEEKINKIRWCQTTNGALFLLSTNDKTIKYWKVQEKKVKKISEMNVDPSKPIGNGGIASSSNSSIGKQYLANGGDKYDLPRNDFSIPPGGFPSLRLPVVVTCDETSLMARCRRVYAHAHDYHINSISNNSDGETFISADDLRINLWNLEISNQSFNIVDVKPANMEDLTEVITSAEFHPGHCNMLAYSSSKGSIRLIDLRQSALCDSHAKLFEEPDTPGSRSFFTEIIASISDIKFARDGRHILSRDYMTLKESRVIAYNWPPKHAMLQLLSTEDLYNP